MFFPQSDKKLQPTTIPNHSSKPGIQEFFPNIWNSAYDLSVLQVLQMVLVPCQCQSGVKLQPFPCQSWGVLLIPLWNLRSSRVKAYIVTMRQGSIYARDDQIAKRVREANGNGEEGGEMMEGDHLVAQEQPIVLGELGREKSRQNSEFQPPR